MQLTDFDFYLPEHRLAIECNGLYWHSEPSLLKREQDGKNYHLYKYLLCKDNGITLIQFFEDTLIFKIDIVKSMLAYKVGKSVKICLSVHRYNFDRIFKTCIFMIINFSSSYICR